jgi:lambda family phage tail tape measure protein
VADDFRVRVVAETQEAEKRLKQVDAAVEKVVKPRRLNLDVDAVNKNFANLKKEIEAASNNIRTFYSVSKKMPVVGQGIKAAEETVQSLASATGRLATNAPRATVELAKSARAGSIISRSFGAAASTTNVLITNLAKLGFTLFALKESVNILKTAFGGLFSETVGRAARFQETLLKTQTTLASTSKVFINDKEITDPLEKIKRLQGEIEDRVDSIRMRSIDLAGVTSNEVVEVFGIVASQISQIGGGLKEAEDLAISFSAALGTFGLPLYQAQQEIGSIFRGDVGPDSYLAKSLGITNADIAKAKTEAGGLIAFLEKKLAAAVAGQTIAAKGLAGVLSNIRDISELISQAIGEPLLEPIIAASTALYDILFESKDLLGDVGTAIGNIFKDIASRFTRAFQLDARGTIPVFDAIKNQAPAVFNALKQDLEGLNVLVSDTLTRLGSAIRELFTSLSAMSATTVRAFRELLDAFIQLKLVSLESLISAIATLAQGLTPVVVGLTKILELWADILRLPIVQGLTQIAVTFAVLKSTGLIAIAAIITQLAIWAISWQAIVTKVKTGGAFIQGVIKSISVSLGSVLLLLGQLTTALKTLLIGQGANTQVIKQLTDLETQLNKAGRSSKGLAYNFRNLGAGIKTVSRSLGALVLNVIKANAVIIAVTVGITLLVDAYGRWKRAQEENRQALRDTQLINQYVGRVQYLNRELTVAEQKLKDAALAAADKKYDEATKRLAELTEEYAKLNKEIAKTEKPAESKRRIRVPQPKEELTLGFESRRMRRRRQLELEIQAERKKETDALAVLEKERAKERVRTEKENRVNLEREITDLRRQLDNDLFQQRQALAQKEVEIFRAAGELRIQQIEKANAKLLEGEEGASRAALAALDNYISTRERGELEIEAAKKTLAIEVGNLEKAIINYRYDIERKIADLRKKSADYEKNAADARARAGQAPGVSAGFRVGSTGHSTGPHLDIRSPTGDKQAVVNEALAIIKHWQGQGVEYIELSNAKIDVKNMVDEAALRGALLKEQAAHATRAGGGAIDIAVPAGTLVPMPAGTPSWGGAGGWQATSLQTGNIFLHGQQASVASPAAGAAPPSAAATGAASELPNTADAAARYAEAVRSLAGAMERLRSLQAAITEAKTAEAFERIAKAVFPQVAIEQYQDQLAQLQFTYNAVSTNAAAAFDPERTALEAQRLAQIAISNRELSEIKAGIAARDNLSESERKRAMDSVLQQHKKYLADLERIDKLKRNILATEQITNFIQQSALRARDIEQEIEALQLRNRLQAEGVAPELIQAELSKLEIQREMNRLLEQANGDLSKQASIRAAAAKQAAAVDALARAQTEPGTRIRSFIGEAERSLKDYEGMAIRVSQSVGDALGNSLANGITGLIEGTTTAKEVFANFLKDVGQILLREGTKMIATYVAIGIAKIFAGLASDNSQNMATQGINEKTLAPMRQYPVLEGPGFTPSAKGAYFSNGIAAFANGGMFTNSVVSSPTLFQFADGGITRAGLMGEAGPEAIMPLERGVDGKLGVKAKLDGAMTRYRRPPGAEGAAEAGGIESTTSGGGVATAAPIDVRYSVERINSVDYVTADQFQRGMAQAANQGAKQGEQLAMRRLQQSASTRNRLGI